MGVSEAMATFVADKCKKGNCAGCNHQRCSHECHRGEIEQTEEPTVLDGPHESPGTGVPMEAIEVPVGETGTLVSGGGDGKEQSDADTTPAPSEPPAGIVFDELPIGWLSPAPDNIRRDLGDIAGLVASIKEKGVLEPLLVERVDGVIEQYQIVAGHRRYAAAVEAGLVELPCVVRPAVSPGERIELMLIENLQRADLAPLEESEGYRRLVDLGMKQRTIGERVGCSQAHVSKRLALLKLPATIRKALDNGGITLSDAVELTKLPDEESQRKAYDQRGSYQGIAGVVAHELAHREMEAKRKKALGELELAGVRILESPWPRDDKEEIGPDDWQLNVDLDEHAKLECHAAFVNNGGNVTLFCTNPEAHPEELQRLNEDDEDAPPAGGDSDDPEAKARREQWEAERKVRQERQQLLEQAEVQRTEAMRAIVEHPDRQAAGDFVLEQFIALGTDTDGDLWIRSSRVIELLGLDDVDLDQYEGFNANPEDLVIREHAEADSLARQRTALAFALAIGEVAIHNASANGSTTLGPAEAFVLCLERHGWEVPEADRRDLEEARKSAAAEAEAIAAQRAEESVDA